MLPTSKKVIVFSGPTSANIDMELFSVENLLMLPPVKRGDIAKLIKQSDTDPGVIVIADGTYFSFPAVGHIEIRDAMSLGWKVWGICSMGAIRAYEMRDMGMRGFGFVYEQFYKYDDFQDDELALLHSDEFPYTSLTEPLLHFRGAIHDLVKEGRLKEDEALMIISKLKEMWFGYRTIPLLSTCVNESGCSITISEMTRFIEKNRVKKEDFVSFFNKKPWL
jgi:hypothetical protein